MNTNPDDATMALWLDDELQGAELAAFESWAASQPEHFNAREDVRHWRSWLAAAIPASEEPPYADLFSARVMRAIQQPSAESPVIAKQRIYWKSLLMPMSACAGMALAFWLGTKSTAHTMPPVVDVTGAPKAIPVEPILYTPDDAVKAEWFVSRSASATVIVLNGLDAIPDSVDFSATAQQSSSHEMDATAALESQENSRLNP